MFRFLWLRVLGESNASGCWAGSAWGAFHPRPQCAVDFGHVVAEEIQFIGHYALPELNQLIIAFAVRVGGAIRLSDEIAEVLSLSRTELERYDFGKLELTTQIVAAGLAGNFWRLALGSWQFALRNKPRRSSSLVRGNSQQSWSRSWHCTPTFLSRPRLGRPHIKGDLSSSTLALGARLSPSHATASKPLRCWWSLRLDRH